MARSIVFHLQGSAGAQSSLVFGMKCRTARDNCQDAGERLVIIDQKVARGGAHEHLHAATAPKLLKGAQCFGILAGGAHIEGKIAVHAILGAAQLAGEAFGSSRRRLRIGHFENSRHATHDGSPATRLQVLLMGQSRFAEVNMRVDNAGENVQAAAIDRTFPLPGGKPPHSGNFTAGDSYVASARTLVIDDDTVCEDEIEA
jgi:hypothetical protein